MRPVMPRSSEAACIFISVNDPRVRERDQGGDNTAHTCLPHTSPLHHYKCTGADCSCGTEKRDLWSGWRRVCDRGWAGTVTCPVQWHPRGYLVPLHPQGRWTPKNHLQSLSHYSCALTTAPFLITDLSHNPSSNSWPNFPNFSLIPDKATQSSHDLPVLLACILYF